MRGRRSFADGIGSGEITMLVPNTTTQMIKARSAGRAELPQWVLRVRDFFNVHFSIDEDEDSGFLNLLPACSACGQSDSDSAVQAHGPLARCSLCSLWSHHSCNADAGPDQLLSHLGAVASEDFTQDDCLRGLRGFPFLWEQGAQLCNLCGLLLASVGP